MHVPGSISPETNYPFAWFAKVKNRTTGKEHTYWINGTHINREFVAAFIATHFRNVEVITIDRCTAAPGQPITPVPPEDYEFGHREAVEKILVSTDRKVIGPQPIAIKPIALKPISLKPLSIRR